MSGSPVLDDAEADRRLALLAELREALSGLGADCVLARHHRLVLRYYQAPLDPSGLTDPQLRIFTPNGDTAVVTTDGSTYRLGSGQEYPVTSTAAAAAAIWTRHATAPLP